MNDWTIILRSLRARLGATLTTVATIAVSVALILTLLSLKDASRDAFVRGSGNMHLLVTREGSPLVGVLNSIFYANPPRALDWSQYETLIDSFPFEWSVPIQLGDSYRGLPVLATTEDFFTRFRPAHDAEWSFRSGRVFEAPFEVVVGSDAARATGLRPGERIFLTHGIPGSRQLGGVADFEPHVHTDFAYTVVGVLNPTGTSHDRALFTDLESSWIIHAHDRRRLEDHTITTTTSADLIDEDRQITGVYLRVATRPGRDATAAKQWVFDALRRDVTLTVSDPVQEIGTLLRIVGSIDWILIALAVAVLISSAIGIVLALAGSMAQRRRQIAVIRVLGCTRGKIFSLVITESACIALIGALAGVLLGIVGVEIVTSFLRYEVGIVLRPTFFREWLPGVVVATIALGALAGLGPAMSAYRTTVLAHLKPAA